MFITLEGGEGCGKTTMMKRLEEMMTALGLVVVTTREPGGTPLSEKVREVLLRRDAGCCIGSRAELLLYLAARAQQVDDVIAPALKDNKVVLCDRFNDSTVAYQGYGRGLDVGEVRRQCHLATAGLEPALTLFFDVSPAVGVARARSAKSEFDQGDRLESEALQFHERVRQGYLTLAAKDHTRIVVVDASRPLQEVFDSSWAILQDRLRQQGLL